MKYYICASIFLINTFLCCVGIYFCYYRTNNQYSTYAKKDTFYFRANQIILFVLCSAIFSQEINSFRFKLFLVSLVLVYLVLHFILNTYHFLVTSSFSFMCCYFIMFFTYSYTSLSITEYFLFSFVSYIFLISVSSLLMNHYFLQRIFGCNKGVVK